MDRKPETGDVYMFKVGKLHYVLQYIAVVDEPRHEVPQFRYRALLIVFANGYRAVPDRPNLNRIYRIKSKPKGQLLYVMLTGTKPSLPAGLRHWGKVEPSGSWSPGIELSTDMPLTVREVEGVQVTPQVAQFRYVRGRIEEDQRRTKHAVVDPLIFQQWIEAVDGSVIMRVETLITDLRERIAKGKNVVRALATCVRALNKLDAKHGFIGTIEAEDLVEVLTGVAVKGGLASTEAEERIDRLRDW